MRTSSWKAAGAAIVGTILLAVIVLLILLYTGAYNVSAAAGHTAIGRWALETMMHNSVEARADVEEPRLTSAMVRAGAAEYKAMCEQCHGAPGVKAAEWVEGMVPNPPELSHAATEWSAGEIHWIVENGIKMTGMPSFGVTHDEQTIWNIAAFVEQLPNMTPTEYAAFPAGHHGGGHGSGGHGSGGQESVDQSATGADGGAAQNGHGSGNHSH